MNSDTPLFARMLEDYKATAPRWQADPYWQRTIASVCESFKNPRNLARFKSSPLETGIQSMLPTNPGRIGKLTPRAQLARDVFGKVPGMGKLLVHLEDRIKIITDEKADWLKRWLTHSYLLLEQIAGKGKTLPESMVGEPDDIVVIEGKSYGYRSLGYQFLYWRAQELIGWENVDTVLELGSGYGGQAEVIALNSPHTRIVCVDIPHWLYVVQMYLSTLFPGQVMGYEETGQINGPVDILKAMGDRKFALIPTWKFQYVKSQFDLFWNSKSLQHMDEKTILDYADRVKQMAKTTFLHGYSNPQPPAYDHEFLRKLFETELGYALKAMEVDYFADKNSVNVVLSK